MTELKDQGLRTIEVRSMRSSRDNMPSSKDVRSSKENMSSSKQQLSSREVGASKENVGTGAISNKSKRRIVARKNKDNGE